VEIGVELALGALSLSKDKENLGREGGRDTEGREVVGARGSRRLKFKFHKGTMREGISVFIENPRNISVLPFTNYDNDNAHSVDSQ